MAQQKPIKIALHKYQEQALESKKRITALVSGIQSGKALWNETPVLTPFGYVRITDLLVGDIVYDEKGQETIVTGVFDQGIKNCCKVSFRDQKSLIACEEHLWSIHSPYGLKPRKLLTTLQLRTTHSYLLKKAKKTKVNHGFLPKVSPFRFKEKNLLIKPWSLGVLIGDGGLTVGGTFSSEDKESVNRLRRELPSSLSLNYIENYDYRISSEMSHKKDGTWSRSNEYTNVIRSLKLNTTSLKKHIPKDYLFSSIRQRLQLLRGLMDTDGTCIKHKETIFYTSSSQLRDDVIFLVESLGGKAWCGTYPNQQSEIKDSFDIRILIEMNPFSLKRKASQWTRPNHMTNKIMESVEPCGKYPCTCISVDSPFKTFITKDQIVTHNTFCGALWLRLMVSIYTHVTDKFLVCAPDYKIMQQATYPKFIEFFQGLGEYKNKGDYYQLNDGRKIWFRSMRDADSVEGISDIRAAWADEAGKMNMQSWININGRCAPRKAKIFISTTPYSLNWLYSEVYKKTVDDERNDVELIQFSSKDNPHFPKDEYERQKKLLDPRVFAMKYQGHFKKMVGLVFMDFDEKTHTIRSFKVDAKDYWIVAGVDWGYTNPFAITVRAINRKTGMDFQIAEFAQSLLDNNQQAVIAKQFKTRYKIELFICDNESPASIAQFNKANLHAVPCKKYAGSVADNIARHNTMIRQKEHQLFKGSCKLTIDEYQVYHYPEGKEEASAPTAPVDKDNHLMTANMYVTQYVESFKSALKQPKPKAQTHLQRLLAGNFALEDIDDDNYEII